MRGQVVLRLQDMLEVATRDMMVNEIRLVTVSLTCAILITDNRVMDFFPYNIFVFAIFASLLCSFSDLVDLGHINKDSESQLFVGTDKKPAIQFPPPVTAQWEEQVKNYLWVPVLPAVNCSYLRQLTIM